MSRQTLQSVFMVTISVMLSGEVMAQTPGHSDPLAVVSRVAGENGSMMTAADLDGYYQIMVGPQGGIDPVVAQQFFVESARVMKTAFGEASACRPDC